MTVDPLDQTIPDLVVMVILHQKCKTPQVAVLSLYESVFIRLGQWASNYVSNSAPW